MDTAALVHNRNPPRSAAPYSPANQSKGKNARIVVFWAMRNVTPPLRRVSADVIILRRIQDPQFLSFSRNRKPRSKSMATKNDQLHQSTMKGKGQEKREEEESVNRSSPPPPPEKPEPGDCCGNGCVRCVWDVYYEELEAYNKLYKSNSKNSISKSS